MNDVKKKYPCILVVVVCVLVLFVASAAVLVFISVCSVSARPVQTSVFEYLGRIN